MFGSSRSWEQVVNLPAPAKLPWSHSVSPSPPPSLLPFPFPVEEEPGPKDPPTPTDDNDTDDVAPPPPRDAYETPSAVGRLLCGYGGLTFWNQRLGTRNKRSASSPLPCFPRLTPLLLAICGTGLTAVSLLFFSFS
jgi:hypothetical protein